MLLLVIVYEMETHFHMTGRQKAVFKCLHPTTLQASYAQDFLLSIPKDGMAHMCGGEVSR